MKIWMIWGLTPPPIFGNTHMAMGRTPPEACVWCGGEPCTSDLAIGEVRFHPVSGSL